MTREEAIAIIRKEYLCVDRDCDIERSCGKCDLVMPSKEPILEAYKMAIKALEQEPCEDAISREAVIKAINDNIGFSVHPLYRAIKELPPVQPQPKSDVLDKIRAEIEQKAKPYEIGGRGNGKSIRYGLCMALEIIDKYTAESEEV